MQSELEQWQKKLSDYVRNPEADIGPEGVESRRLKIYQNLFFNTIEGGVSTTFPVTRSLYEEAQWRAIIRDFMRCHYCKSPFFVELAEEFIDYLDNERQMQPSDPVFLLELVHYEWVELALDISTEQLPEAMLLPGDVLAATLRVSPLAWSLAYQYPVHKISPTFQPDTADSEPTFLMVYRNRQDVVGFLEINAATARLLVLVEEQGGSVAAALAQLALEMETSVETLQSFASELLQHMLALDIVLVEAN